MDASRLLWGLLYIPLTLASSTILAQEESNESETAGTLEEVTVTATRRGEADLMAMPLAITALSGEEVERFAISDLNDVAVAVPLLSNGTVSAFNSAQFSMRGATVTSIILYKESPVGVTLDEFLIPVLQTSNLEIFDIAAVEVLRGPQGHPV